VVLGDGLAQGPLELVLPGQGEALADMVEDDQAAHAGLEVTVRVDALGDVLGEELRLVQLADVMEVGADARHQRVGADGLGGLFGQGRHGQAVVVGPRGLEPQTLEQRVVQVAEFDQGQIRGRAEDVLEERQEDEDHGRDAEGIAEGVGGQGRQRPPEGSRRQGGADREEQLQEQHRHEDRGAGADEVGAPPRPPHQGAAEEAGDGAGDAEVEGLGRVHMPGRHGGGQQAADQGRTQAGQRRQEHRPEGQRQQREQKERRAALQEVQVGHHAAEQKLHHGHQRHHDQQPAIAEQAGVHHREDETGAQHHHAAEQDALDDAGPAALGRLAKMQLLLVTLQALEQLRRHRLAAQDQDLIGADEAGDGLDGGGGLTAGALGGVGRVGQGRPQEPPEDRLEAGPEGGGGIGEA